MIRYSSLAAFFPSFALVLRSFMTRVYLGSKYPWINRFLKSVLREISIAGKQRISSTAFSGYTLYSLVARRNNASGTIFVLPGLYRTLSLNLCKYSEALIKRKFNFSVEVVFRLICRTIDTAAI